MEMRVHQEVSSELTGSLHAPVAAAAKKLRHGLMPREHGAYAQLLLPVLTALIVLPLNFAALSMAVVISAVFLAHEPVLVLIGHRGQKAFDALEDDAWHRLLVLGVVAGCFGGIAAALTNAAALMAAFLPVAMGGVVVLIMLKKWEKRVSSEIWVAVTLASCALPVAFASDAPPALAVAISGGWAMVFIMMTLSVRVMIARTRKEPTLFLRLLVVACAVAIPALLEPVAAVHVAWLTPSIATLPCCVACLLLTLHPPHARYLRQIGWTLAGVSMLTFAAFSSSL